MKASAFQLTVFKGLLYLTFNHVNFFREVIPHIIYFSDINFPCYKINYTKLSFSHVSPPISQFDYSLRIFKIIFHLYLEKDNLFCQKILHRK